MEDDPVSMFGVVSVSESQFNQSPTPVVPEVGAGVATVVVTASVFVLTHARLKAMQERLHLSITDMASVKGKIPISSHLSHGAAHAMFKQLPIL